MTSEECKDERDHQYNVALASIIGVALFVSFVGKYISNMIFMKINKRIHHKIVDSVLHSGLIFFEQNTQGRILNRFSKDIQTLDYLVFDFLEMIDYMTKCFFSIVIIIFVIPWLSVVVVSLPHLPVQSEKEMHPGDAGPHQTEDHTDVTNQLTDSRHSQWTGDCQMSQAEEPVPTPAARDYRLVDKRPHYFQWRTQMDGTQNRYPGLHHCYGIRILHNVH
jgi:ABC-type multidrug transport system fused ATPase/permease subunit